MRKFLRIGVATVAFGLLTGCYYDGTYANNGYYPNNGVYAPAPVYAAGPEYGYAYPAYVGVYGTYPERYRHDRRYDWGYWNHHPGPVPEHWHRHY